MTHPRVKRILKLEGDGIVSWLTELGDQVDFSI